MLSFNNFLKKTFHDSLNESIEPTIKTSHNIGVSRDAFYVTLKDIIHKESGKIHDSFIKDYKFSLIMDDPLGVMELDSNKVAYLFSLLIYKEPFLYDIYPVPKNVIGALVDGEIKIFELLLDTLTPSGFYKDVTVAFKNGVNIRKFNAPKKPIKLLIIPSDEENVYEEQYFWEMIDSNITYQYKSIQDYIHSM